MTSGEDAWDPAQYERFKSERTAPFHDLLALVRPVTSAPVVDLGCGTGELTAVVHATTSATHTVGIDSSPAMLARARDHAGAGLEFVDGDIAKFGATHDDDGVALVFSNAALHWVPDHEGVLAQWASTLLPSGQLAVQVPANADHPSHVIAAQVAASPAFADDFEDEPPADPVRAVLPPERYACLLAELGFRDQHVRLQVYGHWLSSTSDIVEWMKGTSLTRFRAVMDPTRFEAFVAAYRARLLEVVGDMRPCFYPFKRILIWGAR